jgi:hypothetical protein
MHSPHASYEHGSSKRAAAIASLFMGCTNSGGLNSFLTSTYDLDAAEVLDALTALGAAKAAHQLERVLQGLGTSLPATSQDDRWERLEKHWGDDLDEYDVLTSEADAELMAVLEAHVAANEAFYSRLD